MPHAALGFVTCGLSAGFQRCRTNLGSECGALRLGLATRTRTICFPSLWAYQSQWASMLSRLEQRSVEMLKTKFQPWRCQRYPKITTIDLEVSLLTQTGICPKSQGEHAYGSPATFQGGRTCASLIPCDRTSMSNRVCFRDRSCRFLHPLPGFQFSFMFCIPIHSIHIVSISFLGFLDKLWLVQKEPADKAH